VTATGSLPHLGSPLTRYRPILLGDDHIALGGYVFRGDRSSLRVRITLAASAFAALICISVGVVVVVAMRGREAGYDREELTERVLILVDRDALPSVLAQREDEVIQILDSHRRVVAATSQVAGKPPIASFQPTSGEVRAERTLCPPAGLKGCMTVAAFKLYHPGGERLVYTATPVVPWYVNPALVIFLSAMALLMIAMMAFGTSRAVGKTLAPVDAIRTKLAEITATDLDRRVPVPKNKDEIRLLAETVNDSLDRLECAYEKRPRPPHPRPGRSRPVGGDRTGPPPPRGGSTRVFPARKSSAGSLDDNTYQFARFH
jgi:hypothetical protein